MKKNSRPSAPSSKAANREKRPSKNTSYVLLIVLCCFLIYGSSISYDFTNWDDPVHVLENPDIKSFSAENITNMFSPNDRYMYHPLTIFSYALDHSFSKLSPGGYHFVNLVLHILNALLVFYLLSFMFKNNHVSIAGALLFALHPLVAEPVNWISGRKDVLFASFFLSGLLCYLRFTRTKAYSFYIFSLLLFIASMLSKPMAASLPLVLLLLDHYLQRKFNVKVILEKIPFLIFAAAIFIIPIIYKHNTSAAPDSFSYSFTENFTWLNRVLLSVNALLFYPFKFLFPFGLTAYHGFPSLQNNSLPVQYFLMPVLLAIVIFMVLKFGRNKRELVFGLLFYIVTIAPVIHLVPFGTNIYLAERYAYIPMLGLIIIVSGFISKYMVLPTHRAKTITASVVAIVLLVILTIHQNKTWKNSITLWNKNTEVYPEGFYGYFNRGNEYKKQTKLKEALEDYNTAISYNQKFMEAFYNRGNVRSDLNDNQGAIDDFTSAIELNPKYYVAYFNRANSKAALNDFNGAIKDYSLAIHIKPDYEEAYANRGNAKGMIKDYEGSITDYNKSIELSPSNASSLCNRAISRLNLNDKAGACADLQQAAALGNEPAINLFNSNCK